MTELYLLSLNMNYMIIDEAMGMTTVFNCSGVEKKQFLEYVDSNPATYRDWSRTWEQVRILKH